MSSRQDLLIANLKELRTRKDTLGGELKKLLENVKNTKLSVGKLDKEIAGIIDELSGKLSYPILDEIEKAEKDEKTQPEPARLADPIIALPKPDGSIILKYAGRLRKIDANNVPSQLNLNSQKQLEALWTLESARDYTVDEDKINNIHSLGSTKKNSNNGNNSNKKAGVTA